jgi:hypothetical protein
MVLDLQMPSLHVEHQDVGVLYLTMCGDRLTDAPVACGTSGCRCFASDSV